MSLGKLTPPVDPTTAISEEIAAIYQECYGEPVDGIRTYVLDDSVICVIDMALLVHERVILAAGRGADTIREVRKDFQETIGPTFVAAVEHHTGRKVIGFVSDTHLDPPFTIEFFRLASN